MLDILARFDLWLRTDALNLLKVFLVAALLLKLLGWLNARLLAWARREPPDAQRELQIRTMLSMTRSAGSVVVVTIAGMMVLREIGLDVRPILAGAGLVGLAIGFGAQSVVKDVITGFFILVENQYGIGDVIRISGVQGAVEQMTLRRTVIRDGEGAVHHIPNGEIRMAANLTRDWSQVSLAVAVGQRQDVDWVAGLLRSVGQELIEDQELGGFLLEAPRVLGVDKMTGTQVELLMQVRTQPGRQWQISRELRRRIKTALDRAGVNFADPQQVVVLERSPAAPPPGA